MAPTLLQRLKTPWAVAALAVGVLLIGLGSWRWPVPNSIVAAQLQNALDRNTGYAVESFGEASFTALPWPMLQIADLKLRKPSSPHERVDAPLLKARINVASWLFHEPRVVGLTLFDPVIDLVSSEKIDETEALSTAILNFLRRDMRPELRALRVERGMIRLDGQPWMTGLKLGVSNVAASDLRVRAEGEYRGLPVSIAADIAQGASPELRPISWTVSTPVLGARFSGQLFAPRSLDADGAFELAVANGADFARIAGIGAQHGALLDGVKLSGQTRVAWPMILIRQAVIERGQERLEGSVEMSVDARRPALSATLDTKRLDLTALAAPAMAALLTPGGQWSTAPFGTDWLRAATIDIRMSADRLSVGSAVFEHAALSGQLGAGRMEAIVSDARLKAGSVKGRLSLTASAPDAIELRAQAAFDRMDAAQLLEGLGIGRVRGSASGQMSLEATGRSVDGLLATLAGRSQLSARDGELVGIDLDRMTGRVERAVGGILTLEGRTRFQSAALQMRIAQGVATLTESVVATQATRMPLEGTIQLHRRHFNLVGRLLTGGDAARPGDIRLRIEGPWSNPSVMPDLTGRTGRS
jgi:AsmA protein